MALVEQADAAFSSKKYDEAVQLYTEALLQNDNEPKIYISRAKAHNKLENFLEAISDAQHAIELDPKLAAAHFEQGRALHELEEFESARDAFEMAAVLEPSRKLYKNWVDMCKVALGQEIEQEPLQIARENAETASETTAAPSVVREAKTVPKPATAVTIDDPEFSKYWKAPAAATVADIDAAIGSQAKYRHQWFQSETKVEVNVLAKGLPKDRVSVEFEAKKLKVVTKDAQGEVDYKLEVDLWGDIKPEESKYEVLGTKIEMRMVKAEAKQHWPSLDGSGQEAAAGVISGAAVPPPTQATAAAPTAAYPYAGKKVDWNKVEEEVKKEEKEESLDGDAAVMKFFRQLYGDADEDTRRAMMKSYQESGGTALSTNWKEVGTKSYKPEDKEDRD